MQAKEAPDTNSLQCRLAPLAFSEAAVPDEIMVMPAGTHVIRPSMGERVVEATVQVDRSTAAALQQALQAHQAEGLRPWFDFDHDNDAAAGWPTQFLWRDTPLPGVYAKVEWSKSGAEAIAGKDYRSFSPTFFVDDPKAKPARVKGAPVNMGGLVNAPAFKKILPLWAKEAAAAETTQHCMTPEELAQLQARLKQLEKENTELKAKAASSETEAAIAAKDTEIASLKGKIVKFEEVITAHRKAEAKAAVDAAVARGALPPKDQALQAKWCEIIEANPAHAELLAKMPSSPVLKPVTKPEGVIITREANPAVLKGYMSCKDPKERGAFYASEIRPRLKEGDDIPLRAADVTDDNLGTLSGSLVAQRTMELFRLEFSGILSRIATDFSDAAAQYGQTIISRIIVVPAVETYHVTNGWVQQTAAQTVDVPCTIDQHKAVPLGFNTQLLGSTVRRLFAELAPAASYALAKNVIDTMYAVITAANFADPAPFVTAAVDFGRRTFTKVGAIFNKAGVPQTNRFALINSDYQEVLENDPTLLSLAVYQKPEVITEGMLPPIKKFQPLEAPNLPATGNLAAFFGHKSSLLVAARVPNDYTAVLPGASHGSVQIISDPDTGMSVMLVQYVDHQKARAEWRIALMYGVAKGNAKGGQIVKSA